MSLEVSDEALKVSGITPESAYQVSLNGHAVWSFQPARDGRSRLGWWVVPWPEVLIKRLKGSAEVVVTELGSEAAVGRVEHDFGGLTEPMPAITDAQGNPLVMGKWGRLIRPLSGDSEELTDEVLAEVRRLLDVIASKAGRPSFICYGTLLGAVRNGQLIGHDNDVDLAYLSAYDDPVDIAREGMRVERALKDAGYYVRRGSSVRLNVRLQFGHGQRRMVDVFTACWVEGRLYIPSDTGFKLSREIIEPLSEVTLRGQPFPAPHRPERLLAATYGEGWRVPDPSFEYDTPRWLARRFNGWWGGLISGRKYWDSQLAKATQDRERRSSFARWVAKNYPVQREVVELGAGDGTDALWFARKHRRKVRAIDYAAPHQQRQRAKQAQLLGLPVSFTSENLYDSRVVLTLGAQLARQPKLVDIYSRDLLHHLTEDGREHVYRLASMALRRGGLLYLQFRTKQNPAPQRGTLHGKVLQYLRPVEVSRALARHGGVVIEQRVGRDLEKPTQPDSHVCWMVVRFSPQPVAEDS